MLYKILKQSLIKILNRKKIDAHSKSNSYLVRKIERQHTKPLSLQVSTFSRLKCYLLTNCSLD